MLNSYRAAACLMRFEASLTNVSTTRIGFHYLRQPTCGTLGIMLNFDATQDWCNPTFCRKKHRTQQACRSSVWRHPHSAAFCGIIDICRRVHINLCQSQRWGQRNEVTCVTLGVMLNFWPHPTFCRETQNTTNLPQLYTKRPCVCIKNWFPLIICHIGRHVKFWCRPTNCWTQQDGHSFMWSQRVSTLFFFCIKNRLQEIICSKHPASHWASCYILIPPNKRQNATSWRQLCMKSADCVSLWFPHTHACQTERPVGWSWGWAHTERHHTKLTLNDVSLGLPSTLNDILLAQRN